MSNMSMEKIAPVKYALPIMAQLAVSEEWSVHMNNAADPQFSFRKTNQPARRCEDAFEVRTTFLAIKSPEDAARFFDMYGPFQFRLNNDGTKNSSRAEPVNWSVIQKAQSDFEAALTNASVPADLYRFIFGRPLTLEIEFRAVTPELLKRVPNWREDSAIAPSSDVIDALRTTVFLNRMRGFRWKRCARQGCNQLFELDSRRRKIFCSAACAHLKAVNSYNAQKSKTKASEKKGGKA